MTENESAVFENFIKAFSDDKSNSKLEIFDFGVDRPQSPDFWYGLTYLGKVDINEMGYGVDFERDRTLVKFEYVDEKSNDVKETNNVQNMSTISPQTPKLNKEAVARLDAIERNTPSEMKVLPHWCAYKTFYDKEKQGFSKYVLNCNPGKDCGKWANFNDSSTWTTFEKALEYARQNNCAGLSFAIKGTGLNCIDLDNCYSDGKYSDVAERIFGELQERTYIERSRSGKGLHIFLKDNILENGKYKNRNLPIKPTVEIFEDWGFISMTGRKVSKIDNLSVCPQELKKFLQDAVGEKTKRRTVVKFTNNTSDSKVIERIRNSKVKNRFNELYNGGSLFNKADGSPDNSRNDFALINILAYFTDCDAEQIERIFRSSGLYRESKGDRYLRLSIDNAIGTIYSLRTNSPRKQKEKQNEKQK